MFPVHSNNRSVSSCSFGSQLLACLRLTAPMTQRRSSRVCGRHVPTSTPTGWSSCCWWSSFSSPTSCCSTCWSPCSGQEGRESTELSMYLRKWDEKIKGHQPGCFIVFFLLVFLLTLTATHSRWCRATRISSGSSRDTTWSWNTTAARRWLHPSSSSATSVRSSSAWSNGPSPSRSIWVRRLHLLLSAYVSFRNRYDILPHFTQMK